MVVVNERARWAQQRSGELVPVPPLPRGRVFARVAALVLFVVVLYNVLGYLLHPPLNLAGQAFCGWVSGTACQSSVDGFFAGSIALEVRLYWLPGILSLIGLAIIVFPSPLIRKLISTAAAALVVAALWAIQVLAGIAIAAHGFAWGAWLTFGPIATVMSFLAFVGGFVVLVSGLLAGRGP